MASPETAADRAAFFADWSDAATYVLAAGAGSAAVVGRLDEHAALAGGGPGGFTTRPQFQLAESSLPAGCRGGIRADRLEFAASAAWPDGRAFDVMQISRDGTGLALLILGEVEP